MKIKLLALCISIGKAASLLGVSLSTMYRWLKSGEFYSFAFSYYASTAAEKGYAYKGLKALKMIQELGCYMLGKFLIIVFAFNIGSLKANTIFDSCPKNINTDQNLKNEIKEWNFLNEDTNYTLESIRISEEHPSKKYWLLPDNHKNNHYVWNINQSKIDYWLTCSYSNTSIILTKKIDKKYQQCIVDINKKEYICK